MGATIVYRIENELGQGPYVTWINGLSDEDYDYIGLQAHNAENDMKHPSPYQDKILDSPWDSLPGGYIFGFKSPEQLHSWFSKKELKRLREFGFNLVEFEVDKNDTLRGMKQIAFLDPRHVEEYSSELLADWWNN